MDESEYRGEHSAHPLSSEVSQHVRQVLSEAEAAATAMRHEAEQIAQQRRRAAEQEARNVLEDAHRDAEALVSERVRRISQLSDTLVSRAEALVGRLERAEELRAQLQDLVDSLGTAAGELAREVRPETAPAPPRRPAADLRAVRAERPEPVPEPELVEPELVETEPLEDEPIELEPEPIVHSRIADEERSAPADDNLAARLVALQMAVAGGNRGEVEGHLRSAFDLTSPEDILNDVFGPGSGPDTRVNWPEVAGK